MQIGGNPTVINVCQGFDMN